MRRDRDEDDGLAVLLSAISSVLRNTGAIHKCRTISQSSWRDGREIIVEAEIVVSKVNPMDVEAVRRAVISHGALQATIDGLRKENDELKKEPDRAELIELRSRAMNLGFRVSTLERELGKMPAELEDLRRRNESLATDKAGLNRQVYDLERRLRESEQRAQNSSSSARIANLESEIANLRKQLNIGPPAEQDDRDSFAVRASLLELT